MFFVRIALMGVWFFLVSLIALIACFFRWGDINLNRDFAHAIGWGFLKIPGLKLKVVGYENLHAHQPCIYVGNHQGNIDIGVYGKIYPRRTVVIGKKELLRLPIFGQFFAAAGNIAVDRGKRTKAIGSLDVAVRAIRERKVSIWVFPEGTRNKTDALMLPFKKGAFHMAVQANVPVIPMVCSSFKGRIDWKTRFLRPGTIVIHVLPPILPNLQALDPVQELSDRARAVMEREILAMRAAGIGQDPNV